MLKKLSLALLGSAFGLWAANFWVAKPFTEWSDKEVQKIIQDSPWAHQSNYETGGPAGGRSGGTGTGLADASGEGGKSGGRVGGRAPGGPQGETEPTPVATAPVMIRWQSALPVKQALMKRQFGSEVATSPQAKAVLDREEQFYVLYVGMPGILGRGLQQQKDALMEATSLNIKGKDAMHPADVQFNVSQQAAEMYVLFPRTSAIAVEDKEVEFNSKIGRMNVKYKFKLKDMVYNNKLEL